MEMIMVTTERMSIFPISDEEMKIKIEQETNEEIKSAYTEMLACCKRNPEQRIWYAIWLMQLNDGSRQIVGDLCFKGINDNGSVEIGYGMNPDYEGRGLMTEAVAAMAKWAIAQEGVSCIESETDPGNIASQRVLEKSGFVPNGMMGEEGPRFVWKGEV